MTLSWGQLLKVSCKERENKSQTNKTSLVLLKTTGKALLTECFITAVTSSASSGPDVMLTDRNELSIDI